MTPDQIKARMKEMGMLPTRPWIERPMIISCTGGVFEPYVPPEGDGKASALSLNVLFNFNYFQDISIILQSIFFIYRKPNKI